MIDTTPIPNALKELLFTPDYHRAKERYRVEHEGTDRMLRDLMTDTTKIAKIIVHKMIDDADIAEDAYPDLRQKMHDAVDEYEPQERSTE